MGSPVLSPPASNNQVATGALSRSASTRHLPLVLGGLTGLLGLVGMARLASGAFDGGMSRFAWVVVLAAMLPWVAYVAARARHGRLTGRRVLVVLALLVLGWAAVWLSVSGPVLALTSSLAAFLVFGVCAWPARRPAADDRFVRIEELQREEELD